MNEKMPFTPFILHKNANHFQSFILYSFSIIFSISTGNPEMKSNPVIRSTWSIEFT